MKKNIFLVLIAVAASFVSFILVGKNSYKKIPMKPNNVKHPIQLRNKNYFPIQQAGDPLSDDLENSKMISEGSQYGVEYYNRVRQ
ncbi:hypothetical protein ACS127_11455 [Amphibacillus sp. Q70]|uniref:hypothetical protein n=1 Tax=Amphibacillus sp. Q70 TaxID=3453416 RepID=UPI003F842722